MPDIVQPGRLFGYEDKKDKTYWEGLARCYELGLVKNVGVSNYGPTLLADAHAFLGSRCVPLSSNQIRYSLLARNQGNQATVDAGFDLGVRTLAYYPLAMGLLTDQPTAKPSLKRYHAGVGQLADALAEIGQRRGGKSAASVALNWIISNGVVPIVGITKEKYALEAASATGWRLTLEEVARLTAAADESGLEFEGTWFKRTSSKFVGYGVEEWRLD